MNRKIILFIFIFLATHTTILAQEFYKRDRKYVDTATFMIWISPAFSVQSPFGNGYLASTFNFNYNIGAEITAKTKSNWTFGVAFNYMFGSKVKAAPKDILGDILFYHQISEDEIIPVTFNGAGTNSMVLTYEGRYWYLGGSVGKVIPLDRWRNSGLLINVGAGFFSHKINFTDPYHFFPQIDQKTYRLGYDQHSSGIALNQFFGYMFMQKRRVLSFYVGIELWQIFSKPDRGFIFAGKYKGPTNELKRKFSGLVGGKIGWVIPFYEKRRVATFYTY